jgi:hypothetical protein
VTGVRGAGTSVVPRAFLRPATAGHPPRSSAALSKISLSHIRGRPREMGSGADTGRWVASDSLIAAASRSSTAKKGYLSGRPTRMPCRPRSSQPGLEEGARIRLSFAAQL